MKRNSDNIDYYGEDDDDDENFRNDDDDGDSLVRCRPKTVFALRPYCERSNPL